MFLLIGAMLKDALLSSIRRPARDAGARRADLRGRSWVLAALRSTRPAEETPIVWGNQVFVLSAVAKEPPRAIETDLGGSLQATAPIDFVVLALDRSTGSVEWSRVARTAVPHEGTHARASWASASPVTDGEVLIASFGSNGIYAYDLSGNPLWDVDLGDQRTPAGLGEGSSPALHGDTVVVNWDHEDESFVVALDKLTGEERWRRQRDEPIS